ncbi:MAG: WD40 repeat domain-containing protein [Myxococcota bacterium]
MASLVDQFCPNVHDAAITAATYDPWSGTWATADANGVVAVTRQGEATPGLVFQPGGPVTGALGLIRGGSLLAVGDDNGTIGVYSTENGEAWFQEVRDGARGRVRAMRGVAVSPEGARVATIAIDGLLRIWNIEKAEREVAWQGFGGQTVEFDERGSRILCLDGNGQPRLVDLLSHQGLPMDKLQTPAERATFSLDGTLVVTAGQSGIALLRVVDGVMVASFATRGGSGILNILQSPDGSQIGAVSTRSVHVFSMPDLQPVDSKKHGAPEPSGAAYWGPVGIRVGGSDGLMHAGGSGSAGPVTVAGGFGDHRIAVHGDSIAVWQGNRRVHEFPAQSNLREIYVDREGRLVVAVPQRGPMAVYDCSDGRKVFDGGPETSGTPAVGVGGNIVAAQLASGGVRWWDIGRNRALELKWPTGMCLSHGGTWLGVITPRGAIKIIDPAHGKEAIPDPLPSADVPARLLSFVNRRPDLLVVDAENILAHYDLAVSVRENRPCEARDVLQFGATPDKVWGITGGQYAALRIPDGDHCTIVFVDVHAQAVISEVTGLHPAAWVDAEQGFILEPARAAAVLERDMEGNERRVLRALPDDQWICFGKRGILDASEEAGGTLGG